MQFQFNGQSMILPKSCSLAEVLKAQAIEKETPGIAVALNSQIILRSEWEDLKVQEGDLIEVIHAVQGG